MHKTKPAHFDPVISYTLSADQRECNLSMKGLTEMLTEAVLIRKKKKRKKYILNYILVVIGECSFTKL